MKELMFKITFLVPGLQKSQVDIYVGKFDTLTFVYMGLRLRGSGSEVTLEHGISWHHRTGSSSLT